ncbi:hypothetical protein CPLU01_07360 [Colletotrichum plurivorum]|uniref:Secreted protein n=1 Tax=Colletotrichum plurivorum TaxID=2175906 RepID=A0A8H6NEH7_9PEZI|nr:hypothetical protein CPLU01_07360 [Colletotrichum plurivorum]
MLSAVLLAASATGPCVYALEAPIPGYGVFIPRWEVPGPGGKMLTLRGTVEEVAVQVRDVNPEWEDEAVHVPITATQDLEKRATFNDSTLTLCHNFREGNRSAASLGVDYLRTVPGRPRNGAGPSNCGRVSCRNNTGIWFCNDAKKPKELGSFSDIADGAARVLSVCQDKLDANQGEGMTVSGQAFHRKNWNVVVRGGDDCSNTGVNITARDLKPSRLFKLFRL